MRKFRERLLEGACENLIETRCYFNVWVALLDESGKYVTHAEAGLGKDFLPVLELLKKDKLTQCGQKVLDTEGVLVIEDPLIECRECPLAVKYSDRSAMVVRLEHGGKVFGKMAVSVPKDIVMDKEEQDMFHEVVTDIAYALYSIGIEEERWKAEQEATRHCVLFDKISDMNPYSVRIFDKEGHHIKGNRAFIELFNEAPKPEYSIFYDPNLKKAEEKLQEIKSDRTEPTPFRKEPKNKKVIRCIIKTIRRNKL